MPISPSFIPQSRKLQRKLDPHGRLDYTIDWSEILNGSAIVERDTTLSAESIAAGLQIDAELTQGLETVVRFSIATEDQDDPAFDAPDGAELAFKQTVEDDTGQIWEFSFSIPVVQQ